MLMHDLTGIRKPEHYEDLVNRIIPTATRRVRLIVPLCFNPYFITFLSNLIAD